MADFDVLNDILLTFRYFCSGSDLMRILIIRYVEWHLKPNAAFAQLRILNVMKKWILDHPLDFSSTLQSEDDLCHILDLFLEIFVLVDAKKSPVFIFLFFLFSFIPLMSHTMLLVISLPPA